MLEKRHSPLDKFLRPRPVRGIGTTALNGEVKHVPVTIRIINHPGNHCTDSGSTVVVKTNTSKI